MIFSMLLFWGNIMPKKIDCDPDDKECLEKVTKVAKRNKMIALLIIAVVVVGCGVGIYYAIGNGGSFGTTTLTVNIDENDKKFFERMKL